MFLTYPGQEPGPGHSEIESLPMYSSKKLIPLIVSAFVLFFAGSAGAASETPTEHAWVQQALESNASLAARLASANAAAARITGSDSWQDPSLNLMLAPATLGGDEKLGQRIEISQAIPWPGSLSAQRAMAEAKAEVSVGQHRWARNRLVADVKAAYAEWWFINEALRLHHQNQAHVEQLLANATESYAYGHARRTDLLQLRQELSDLDMQQVELAQQRQALAARVAQLLGAEPAPENVVLRAAPLSLPDLQTVVDEALRGHPLQVASQSRVQASQAEVRVRQLEKYPKVKVMAGYNSLWADPAKRMVVGVGIELPFSGRRQQSALNVAEAELQAQRWEALEQTRDIEAEVTQAWEKAAALISQMDVLTNRSTPLAEEHWQASLEQVANRQSGIDDAIESARVLTRTHLQQARLKADIYRAMAVLDSWTRFKQTL